MTDIVLFPSDPLNERVVDPEFAAEWAALRWSEIQTALIDHDALVNHGEIRIRLLPAEGRVLYRGWMVTVEQYKVLNDALTARGLDMVTNYLDYWYAHHLPMWVDQFQAITPETRILNETSAQDAALVEYLGEHMQADAFIVKDYVKSRKSEWASAMYAPTAADLPRVVTEFMRLQGEFLQGGVVVRAFENLDKTRPEYRIWWTQDGRYRFVGLHPDYNPAQYATDFPAPLWLDEVLVPLVVNFDKPFIVTDIAFKQDGTPVLIEIGDGQVSGLPQGVDDDVYTALIENVFPTA